MTLEQYAYLAEIIGMAIVVVTLIFLAIQSSQNGALMRSEARRAQVNTDIDLLNTLIESPDIAQSFAAPGKLEFDKKLRLYFWLIAFARGREHQWFEYRKGVLDETAWSSYKKVITWTFQAPRNRLYWEYFKENFDKEFVELVEREMQRSPASVDFWQGFSELE